MKTTAVFLIIPICLTLLILAGCSDAPAGAGSQAAEAASPALDPYDLTEAAELQAMLLQTTTRLELSQSEFMALKPMLPDSVTALAEGLIPSSKVAKVFIKDGNDLLRFSLTEPGLTVPTVGGDALKLGATLSIKRILAPDATYAFHRIGVDGLTFGDQAVAYMVLLSNGDLALGLADGGVATVTLPSLQTLFSSGDPLEALPIPDVSTVVEGLFMAANSIRISPAANTIHIVAKKLGADKKPLLDAQGRPVPDTDNKFRKMLRDEMAKAGVDAQLLTLIDRITDVVVDKTGVKFWLSYPLTMNFNDGQAIFGNYVELRMTGARSMVPVKGVGAVAYQADGAYVQQFRYTPLQGGGRIDVDVYGYRKTLLGTFGDTRTVSFPF